MFPTIHSCLSTTTISLSAVMSFVNSSHTVITGENTLNHVQGNQVNSTINADTVYFNAGQAVAKRTERDEFQYVRRGHMVKVKELHSGELSKCDWKWQNGELVGRYKSSAQRTIYTVEIAKMHKIYERRILDSSRVPTSNPQLFGINQSAIPALIFHHELIPCAHLYTGSLWMHVYIRYLARNMGCLDKRLWMNTTSGVLFSGPDGPFTQFLDFIPNKSIVVPPTIDMLKDDTSFRFFSKFGRGVDDSVLECALSSSKHTLLDDLSPWMAEDHRSKDADHSDWSSAMPHYLRYLWWNPPDHLSMDVIDGLVDRTELDGGLIRFKLVQEEHVDLEVYYHWSRFRDEWILQSSWVFDALDITEGKENFFIVEPPCLGLRSTQCPTTFSTLCNAKHPVEETSLKPIYLFVHPPPTTLSKLVFWLERPHHFWSFDKTGQSQLSEEECEWWGLPVLVPDTRHPIGVELYSWPTHIYTALQDWQKAMGFDPTTSDWAQSRGYLELEIVGTEDRFVLVEKTSDESGISNEDSEWEVLGA
ncbi:hypothetical protein WG66_006503 [Moniliophthora roreri]|nr:hypothetical protein WG66_006503 [Moniliophthora roreri]